MESETLLLETFAQPFKASLDAKWVTTKKGKNKFTNLLNKFSKLMKSLYDLKQAPKQWHGKFYSMIMLHGFKHNNDDKCIYSKLTNKYSMIICSHLRKELLSCVPY